MKIAEIFYSIQGEGSLVGVPSVFIRTSGCNLRCIWCDTPYTSWHPEGSDVTLDRILQHVSEYPASHVVVTGGEPMIAPQVRDLTNRLRGAGLHITVETAATVFVPVACDLMSISPKLKSSVPLDREEGRWAAQHERLRFQPDILRRLMSEYSYQLKFVVSSIEDLDEIETICAATGAANERVMLMPEGTRRKDIHERSLWMVEICKSKGYRFSPRLHVDLWGDRRGI